MKPGSWSRRGFSLIELLVVIAIMAILMALLFPVFAGVRENAKKDGCTTNMRSIITAMKMYKDDFKVFPDGLYGISYDGTNLQPRLFPEYEKDEKIFNCPNAPFKLDGAGRTLVRPINPMNNQPAPWAFPQFDSYDFQFRPGLAAANPGTPELRYNRKWTTLGGVADEVRQLYYRNPPDSTVVTWCLYHSKMNSSGSPGRNEMALVGYLSGRVERIPAERVASWSPQCTRAGTLPPGGQPVDCPWQVPPKP